MSWVVGSSAVSSWSCVVRKWCRCECVDHVIVVMGLSCRWLDMVVHDMLYRYVNVIVSIPYHCRCDVAVSVFCCRKYCFDCYPRDVDVDENVGTLSLPCDDVQVVKYTHVDGYEYVLCVLPSRVIVVDRLVLEHNVRMVFPQEFVFVFSFSWFDRLEV